MGSDIKFLTVEDVAEMLQVTRTTIYNLKKKGLPFIKLGKNIRFDEEAVVEWVKSNTVTETEGSKDK
ncbi:MAG: helix-turn-helix domain-containing protein [Lentihominibacter sp.]